MADNEDSANQPRESISRRVFLVKAEGIGAALILGEMVPLSGRRSRPPPPIVPNWNPSGYLWNVIDQVRIRVDGS